MPLLTLKIDADTYRGTREGVPRLIRLLKQYQADATFLFSLGYDHTGWAWKQVFRPGFFQKASRTSVLEHYGLKTLLYGVLLPAPHIGKVCVKQMRAAADAGFECGVHTWDHRIWQDHVRKRDANWTTDQMQCAFDQFQEIFGTFPSTHGAAGWQMNPYAFEQLEKFGISYASDGRARLTESGALVNPAAGPHRLQINGKNLHCVQLPTTLPTLDELLGRKINGTVLTKTNVANHILGLTATARDHVFTLHAELEGQKLAPIFEQLLQGWQHQGYQLVSMKKFYQKIQAQTFPVLPLEWATLPGRSGSLVVQADAKTDTRLF